SLEQSKADITRRQNEIAIREQITQKLREVQNRYEGLSQNATQQELTDAQEAIAKFAEALTALQYEAKYQEILENISDQKEQLKQQITVYVTEGDKIYQEWWNELNPPLEGVEQVAL
ncbi:MAG: hypothetical protein ACK45T_09750, partial [Pseudanabaena sp.]